MRLCSQVVQAGVTVSSGAEGGSTDDLRLESAVEDAAELSLRVASASVAHDNTFTRGGPTESKSEPLLHHGGQAVVRLNFVVEAPAHPVLGTLALDGATDSLPSLSGALSPTKVKGRFLVTTTRDSKSDDKGGKAGQDDETNATAAPNASSLPSLPSHANTDDGSPGSPKKAAPSSVSSTTSSGSDGGTNSPPTPAPSMFYIKHPLGRPVKVSLGRDNMFHMSRTGSFDILHSAEVGCQGQGRPHDRPRSASLCSSPPVYPPISELAQAVYSPISELALSGPQGSGTTNHTLTKPSIAHVFTQMSSETMRDLTDIATQTSPCPPGLKSKLPHSRVSSHPLRPL